MGRCRAPLGRGGTKTDEPLNTVSLPPIAGFIQNTLIEWEGKLAAEVFLPGCNFRCPFCHASHLVHEPPIRETIPIEQILDSLSRKKGWIDGVVISGGEPTLHKTLPELIEVFRAEGLGVKLDTNGSRPEVLSALIKEGLLSAVSMDIKAPLESEAYRQAVGLKIELEPIYESTRILMNSDLEYEFRTTVVPTLHTEGDILQIARSITGARCYILQQFSPMGCLDPRFDELKPPSREFLKELANLASRHLPTRLRGTST